MCLDGLYMASPFLAEYAAKYGEVGLFDEVAHQIITMAKHSFNPNTGCIIMVGTKVVNNAGRILKRVLHPIFGREASVGI